MYRLYRNGRKEAAASSFLFYFLLEIMYNREQKRSRKPGH